MASLNIVELIESNPMTKLTNTYQNKLLMKIKDTFTDEEQQMFVASFYCFLKYNPISDFVIDLDDVWQWIGFSTKQKAKDLLEKNFVIDMHYKALLNQQVKQRKGGHNKINYMLSIKTFKLFCLKAGTSKAEQIHEYYINLEEMLHDVIQEESNDFKAQLEKSQDKIEVIEKNQLKIKERTLLEQFSNNDQCVYYGIIDNVSDANEPLIKFGNSNNLKGRVSRHRESYINFRLINAFRVENKLQIENAIKEHPILNQRLRSLTINNKKRVELLSIEKITFNEIDKIIKDIIKSIEFTTENFIKLLNDYKALKKENIELKEIIHTKEISEERQQHNIQFKAIFGTRQEVWDGIAMKTRGMLFKQDLMNKDGVIISRLKHNMSLNNKGFGTK